MFRRSMKVLAVILGLALLASAQIPAGTVVPVRVSSEISSATAKPGDTFQATLAKDLVVDGKVVAKKGTPVSGKVTAAKPSGRLHAPGQLTLRLTSISLGDQNVALNTTAVRQQGKSHTRSNAEKIGGGAVAGAVIGAIAGGGKGAAIGTMAGGAAGTGVAAYTGKQEAVVPAEALLTFKVTGSGMTASRTKTSKTKAQ